MSESKLKYISILIIVLIPLTIVLSNVTYLATNYNFYIKIYQNKNIYSDFSDDQILKSETQNLLGYYRGENILDQNFYSDKAVRHLKDVRSLLIITKFLSFGFLILILVLSTLLYFSKAKKKLINACLRGSLTAVVLTAAICVLLLLSFQQLFLDFHLIFFRNSDWLFEPTDNLIRMFPQEFFISFAFYLATNIIASALFISLLALIVKKINDKPNI